MTRGGVADVLRRVGRWVRWLTTPVQPWDWDELPVRHWWDVYAK